MHDLVSDEQTYAAAQLLEKWGLTHGNIPAARAVLTAFVESLDGVPYDPHGPEVSMLHQWFAEHASPSNWHDDGCRSENARDLLNAFSAQGFILVPAKPRLPTEGT